MSQSSFVVTLASTAFAVAFLHAAIPTHWLPFVAVGRTRKWSSRRILTTALLAGGGHVLATTILGIGIARFGLELSERYDAVFHWTVAALLVGLGAWLAFRAPHGHACDHCQGHPKKQTTSRSDKAVMGGLFLSLTLSPCELFLPVYLTASPYGWPGILLLSGVLAFATIGAMVLFTWLTLVGSKRVSWLEELNHRIVGALLCILGFATVAFAH